MRQLLQIFALQQRKDASFFCCKAKEGYGHQKPYPSLLPDFSMESTAAISCPSYHIIHMIK
jgi:hypothetical protein